MTAPTLIEYDNPFVAGLGPMRDIAGQLKALTSLPHFSPAERALPPQERRLAVMRLLNYHDPLNAQLELADKIEIIIRQGYGWRDPRDGAHHAAILDAVDRNERGDLDFVRRAEIEPTASGFALLSPPGLGKSTTTRRKLATIPRLLRPALASHVLQVPWLMFECPSNGSRKQACMSFFQALGSRVGKGDYYLDRYAGRGVTADTMVGSVQLLAQIHALGVLVIDEIQNANVAVEGREKLLNFLVSLVNQIGVPVILIGTNSAAGVIQEDFRGARRACGLGGLVWDRLVPGTEWDGFIRRMWTYQWTASPTPLDDEVSAAIYERSQGIIDIALKLFMLCQFRALVREEMGAPVAPIGRELVETVAREELKLVEPMLLALRDGRPDKLAEYPDLKPFHAHVEGVMLSQTGRTAEQFREEVDAMREAEAARAAAPDDEFASIRSGLRGRGLNEDEVALVMLAVESEVPSRDFFLTAEAAGRLADARRVAADAPGSTAATKGSAKTRSKPRGKSPGSNRSSKGAKPVPDLSGDIRGVAEAISF